jgi:hypothetical protein
VLPPVNHLEQDTSVTPPLIFCLLVIGHVVPCGVGQVNQNSRVQNLRKGSIKMAKTVTDAEMRKFRENKRKARRMLNAMLAAGEITGPEFNKRVNTLSSLKVGQTIPRSLVVSDKKYKAELTEVPPLKDGKTAPKMMKPTPPPAGRKKKKNEKTESMITPTPPPKGRKKKRAEKLYDTIDPRTGKPSGNKVSASRHLANIDAFKKREKEGTVMTEEEAKRGSKTAKELLESLKRQIKKNKGNNDMRKGGMVINTVDNRRNK